MHIVVKGYVIKAIIGITTGLKVISLTIINKICRVDQVVSDKLAWR